MADSSEVDLEAVDASATDAEWGAADHTDISKTSGCSRLCNSFVTAFCVAPLVILGMCFLLGWNERRAVCSQRAISQGLEEVVEVGCDATASSGELVKFSCDLKRDGLPTFTAAADFSPFLTFQGVGLQTTAEMYQCVEKSQSKTTKDRVGGGSTTITTYTYERQWVSSHVDSSRFQKKSSRSFKDNCGEGAENPSWPSAAPATNTQHAASGSIGPYTVPHGSFLSKVPLDDPLEADSTPVGWARNGFEYTLSSTDRPNSLGSVRVRFHGNNWEHVRMTVLGRNNDGVLERWTAPDSWLCSGFQLGELRMGTHGKDELFAALQAESSVLTTVLRLVAFLVMWMGFCCIFKPLEVAADCIPWIGPCLGDKVACIIGIATCPAACGCSLGVAGAVWVVMRPVVGICMLSVFGLCLCGFVTCITVNRRAVRGGPEAQSSAPTGAEPDAQPCAPTAEQLGDQPEVQPDAPPDQQPDAQPDSQMADSPPRVASGLCC